MPVRLFDAHTHIKSREELLSRTENKILSLVSAGNPKEAENLSLLLEDSFLSAIPSFGLHPWQAESFSFQEMEPWLIKAPVIGEIGMDSVWCSVPLSVQEKAFTLQLELACALKKPVILHTKGQEKKIASLIRNYENTYLVHWYSGEEGLSDFLELDCYFSIGPDVFYNPAVQKAACLAPENRLLAETDGCSAVKWAYDGFFRNRSVREGFRFGEISETLLLPDWQDVRGVLEYGIRTVACLRKAAEQKETGCRPGVEFFLKAQADRNKKQARSQCGFRRNNNEFSDDPAMELAAVMEENFLRFTGKERV